MRTRTATPTRCSGLLNVPLGDTLAFRASAKYAYEPGGSESSACSPRTDNGISGIPLLANPADPVNSPGIYSSRDDWN